METITLQDGRTLTIRPPVPDDAEAMVAYVHVVDSQTPYLGRNPGEFALTPEQERALINGMGEARLWLLALIDGQIVGMVDIGIMRNRQRMRHRAGLGISVLQDVWGLGVGSRLMERSISWCREKGLEQIELEVVDGNERAIALYEKFGFQRTGCLPRAMKYPNGSYADEVTMVLRLS